MLQLKPTLSFFLDNRTKRKADGKHPVKMIYKWKKKRNPFSIGIFCSKEEWQDYKNIGIMRGNRKKAAQNLANQLQEAEDYAQSVINKMEEHSFQLFKQQIEGPRIEKRSLEYWFLELIKKQKSPNSRSTYQFRYQKVKEYFKADFVDILSLTPDRLRAMDDYFKARKRPLGATSRNMIFSTLKAVWSLAEQNGIVTKKSNPFGKDKFIIPKAEKAKDKKILTEEELLKIYHFSSDVPRQQFARDMIIFSFICNGMNVGDILRLNHNHLQENIIRFHRKKTVNTKRSSEEIVTLINEEGRRILDRYHLDTDGFYLFPVLKSSMTEEEKVQKIKQTTVNLNKTLKHLAKKLTINPNVSTGSARTTYATLAARKGHDVTSIKEALGHSSITVTEHYLSSIFQEERAKKIQESLEIWKQDNDGQPSESK